MTAMSDLTATAPTSATSDRRIVVITGANSGIGKSAAKRFAAAGDHVVMACRNVAAGERALAEVRTAAASAGAGGRSDVMELDVAAQASIHRFCQAFADRFPRLDVLIHNAGYFNHGIRTYQYSPDGVELTFATNVFGPLLLTEGLLDALGRSHGPRVLTAGSTAIKTFFDPDRGIEFDNLRGEHAQDRPYSVYRMYGDSKMGIFLMTRAMAEAYHDRGIAINCVMIPTVRVERQVLRKFSSWFRVIGPLYQYLNPFARPPARLADTYYRICTDEAFRTVSGALIDHKLRVLPVADRTLAPPQIARELFRPTLAPPYAGDPANVERIWELGRELVAGSGAGPRAETGSMS
jgi:NAD(P)-dependent dehydrogenase (short-subunit alcohol dehydrogenase family)